MRVLVFLFTFLVIPSLSFREIYFHSNLIAKTSLPSYAKAEQIVSKLWEKKYLIKIRKLLPNPEGKGILCGIWKRKRVCYYHFHAILNRPFRSSEMKIILQKGRQVQFWLQFIPQRRGFQNRWMLWMQRLDFLPGTSLRWKKI